MLSVEDTCVALYVFVTYYFFFNETATAEIYTFLFVGSVMCV